MKGSQSQATGLFIFLRQLQQYWRILSQDKPALISFWILVLFIGVAVTAPWLPLADPKEFTMVQYARPGTQYWMGTDNLSRDLFSRVIWGGRLGLLVAVVSAGIASVLGVVVGGLAGYYGGWVDDVLSRVIDIFLMIPTFFLALLIIALFGSSIFLIMVVIGLTTWPRPARIMRSQVLTLKSRTFVKATRVSGASNYQILFRHIIPNGIPPVITTGTLLMGSAILIEAGLSFLGLGDPSTTSWGRMIQLGQRHIRIAPWMSVFPGVAMLVMVTSFNLLGDALNRALQPQLQERKRGHGWSRRSPLKVQEMGKLPRAISSRVLTPTPRPYWRSAIFRCITAWKTLGCEPWTAFHSRLKGAGVWGWSVSPAVARAASR